MEELEKPPAIGSATRAQMGCAKPPQRLPVGANDGRVRLQVQQLQAAAISTIYHTAESISCCPDGSAASEEELLDHQPEPPRRGR